MKTIDYYLNLPYKFEIVPDQEEGGFIIRYPDLPGCISVAEKEDDIIANANDAKRAWLEAAIDEGIDINEPDLSSNYSGQFRLRLPKSLHRSLAEHAKAEGTSMNQYCLYLLSKNEAATEIR